MAKSIGYVRRETGRWGEPSAAAGGKRGKSPADGEISGIYLFVNCRILYKNVANAIEIYAESIVLFNKAE